MSEARVLMLLKRELYELMGVLSITEIMTNANLISTLNRTLKQLALVKEQILKTIKGEVVQILNSISYEELSKNQRLKKAVLRIKKLLLHLK
jgi:hypothetical protein